MSIIKITEIILKVEEDLLKQKKILEEQKIKIEKYRNMARENIIKIQEKELLSIIK